MSKISEEDSKNIEDNFLRNWQYIYDNAKAIQKEIKTNSALTTDDLLKSNPEFKIFKEKFPKSWNSIIEGTFSLIEFKKQKEVYVSVYKKKEGDHYDKKNLANIALGNKLAKDYKLYGDKEPSTQEMQDAYTKIMAKNEIARSNIKKK